MESPIVSPSGLWQSNSFIRGYEKNIARNDNIVDIAWFAGRQNCPDPVPGIAIAGDDSLIRANENVAIGGFHTARMPTRKGLQIERFEIMRRGRSKFRLR